MFFLVPLILQSNSCCCSEAAVFILTGLLLLGSGNNQMWTHADHLLQGGLHCSDITGIALDMRVYFNFITITSQKIMQIWMLFCNGKW